MDWGIAMEKFTLYIEYTTVQELKKQLTGLLNSEAIKFIELHIIFLAAVSNKALRELLETEKELSLEKETVFVNYAVIKHGGCQKGFIRRLFAKDFCLELHLDDNTAKLISKRSYKKLLNSGRGAYKLLIGCENDFESAYNKYFEIGLPLNFAKPDYSADLRPWFDSWATDKRALPVNIFDQILRVVLLSDNTHNCCFNSCLGKNLYISADSAYSFCPKNPEKSVLQGKDISAAEALLDIFDNPDFISLLSCSLKNRAVCLEKCEEFAFCQGGCPLKGEDNCTNRNYVMLVLHIKRFMEEVLKSNDLSKYNYSIKDAVYTALSFNSTFGILNNERGTLSE